MSASWIAIVRDDGDTRLPEVARQVLQVLAGQIEQIETAVAALERQLLAWHKSDPVSQRLASIPGIGPIIATAIATTVADPKVGPRVRRLAGLGAAAEFNRRQNPAWAASPSAATVICAGCSSTGQAPICYDRRRPKPIHG